MSAQIVNECDEDEDIIELEFSPTDVIGLGETTPAARRPAPGDNTNTTATLHRLRSQRVGKNEPARPPK